MTNVDVCVITYKRPAELRQLLVRLSTLVFVKVPTPNIRIIIVDNDPLGSAREIYSSIDKQYPWLLHFVHETNRGIPQARNRAINEARTNVDFIAFIDDDEEPTPEWMDELLSVHFATGALIVYGPVIAKFVEEPPKWIIDGEWFNRKSFQNEQELDLSAVGSGNILISIKVFLALGDGKWFDENLALIGGSDTHFFMRAKLAGYKIIGANAAVVYEWQPAKRTTVKWILMRAFRTAYTQIFLDKISTPFLFAHIKRFFLGLCRIVIGALLIIPFLVFAITKGKYVVIKPIRIIFRGAGMLASAFGIKYEEYR